MCQQDQATVCARKLSISSLLWMQTRWRSSYRRSNWALTSRLIQLRKNKKSWYLTLPTPNLGRHQMCREGKMGFIPTAPNSTQKAAGDSQVCALPLRAASGPGLRQVPALLRQNAHKLLPGAGCFTRFSSALRPVSSCCRALVCRSISDAVLTFASFWLSSSVLLGSHPNDHCLDQR